MKPGERQQETVSTCWLEECRHSTGLSAFIISECFKFDSQGPLPHGLQEAAG